MSRKPFDPEQHRESVKAMKSVGIDQISIAQVVGCDAKTLRKYFREELDTAKTIANAKVAGALYRRAIGTGPQSVTAAIFWCKTQMGWKEQSVVENVGKDGGPIRHMDDSIDLDKLSLKEKRQLLKLQEKAIADVEDED